MPGELIGEAFVAIHATGRTTKREIVDIAERDGEDYVDALDDSIDKEIKRKLHGDQSVLARLITTKDANESVRRFGTIEAAVDRVTKTINEQAYSNRINLNQAQTYFEQLDESVERYNDQIEASQGIKDLTQRHKDWADAAKTEFKQWERQEKEREREQIRMAREQTKRINVQDRAESSYHQNIYEALNRNSRLTRQIEQQRSKFAEQLDQSIAKAAASGSWNDLYRRYGTLEELQERVNRRSRELEIGGFADQEGLSRVNASLDEFVIHTREAEEQARRFRIENDRAADRSPFWARRLVRLGDRFDGLGRRSGIVIGRMFGKGSRNNFFNAIGGIIGAISSLPLRAVELFAGAIGTVGKALGDVVGRFRDLRALGVGVFAAAAKSIIPLAGSLAAGLVSLAAGAAAVVVVLPALVSGFALLGGAIISVAGALAFALAGALLPLVPLLVGVAAGLAPLAPLIGHIGAETDAVTNKLKPFKEAWETFLKGTQSGAEDLAGSLGKIAPVLEYSIPFVNRMSTALSDVVDYFAAITSDDSTKKFLSLWGESLPRIFESFGRGLANLTDGLISFFAPILPYAEKMASAFEQITDRFNEWATSVSGQKSIADFMESAYEQAGKLRRTIGNVFDILGSLFSLGTREGGGAEFLTYLEDVTETFKEFLRSPEGEESVKSFFASVKETMIEVKDIIEDVGETLRNLDTDQAREDFLAFIGYAESLSATVEKISVHFEDARASLGLLASAARLDLYGALQSLADLTVNTDGWFPSAAELVLKGTLVSGKIWEGVRGFFSGLADQVVVTGWFPSVSDLLQTGSNLAGYLWDGITSFFSALGEKIPVTTWFPPLGELAEYGREAASDVWSAITGFFSNLSSKISVSTWFPSVGVLTATGTLIATNVWNAITGYFTGGAAGRVNLGNVFPSLGEMLELGTSLANNVISGLSSFFLGSAGRFLPSDIVSIDIETVLQYGRSIGTSFIQGVQSFFDSVTSFSISETLGIDIGAVLQEGVQVATSFVQGIVNFLLTPFEGGIDVASIIGLTPDGILQSGIDAANGFVSGVVSGVTSAAEGATGAGKQILDKLSLGLIGGGGGDEDGGGGNADALGRRTGTGVVTGIATMALENRDFLSGKFGSLLSAIGLNNVEPASSTGKGIGSGVTSGLGTAVQGYSAAGLIASKMATMQTEGATGAQGITTNVATGLAGLPAGIGGVFQLGLTALNTKTGQMETAANTGGQNVDTNLASGLSGLGNTVSTKFADGVSEATIKMSAVTAMAKLKAILLVYQVGNALNGLAGVIQNAFSRGVSAATAGASRIVSAGSFISRMVPLASSALAGLAGAIGGQMSRALSVAIGYASRIAGVLARVRATASAARSAASAGASIGRGSFATGGLATGPSLAGESGPELIIPLTRNVSTVDPMVRDITAAIQAAAGSTGGGGTAGRVVNVQPGAIVVQTPTRNPELVAESVLDRLVETVQLGG